MTMGKQTRPVHKNEIVEVTIDDFTHDGNGVGKIDNYPLFIPHTIIGETVRVKVVRANKRFGYGKLLDVMTPSPERKEPPCDVFYRCGGCQLQHMSYPMQLKMKRQQVQDAMKRIARFEDVPVHPVIGMKDPWRYRNKIQMPVGEKHGELITGFYQPRSHRIIDDMETCIIQDETGDKIVEAVRQIASRLGIRAYDEKKHQGVLRHIITRTGYKTGDTMVILVTRTKKLPKATELIHELTKQFPRIKSIIHNINDQRTNVILGKQMNTLYGTDYIYDTVGDLTFTLSPRSFFQVNPEQTKVLYDKALEYAQVDEEDIVVDAYCGIGTISLFLAKHAKKVYGVEIIPDAVKNAQDNAKLNNIDNAEFITGKAEDVFQQWKKADFRPNVVVVDPPRKGCDEKLLEVMVTMAPDRIVYVSCNPATLARDLRILADRGYKTEEVQPVEMFAQTSHVECVSLLQRETI